MKGLKEDYENGNILPSGQGLKSKKVAALMHAQLAAMYTLIHMDERNTNHTSAAVKSMIIQNLVMPVLTLRLPSVSAPGKVPSL